MLRRTIFLTFLIAAELFAGTGDDDFYEQKRKFLEYFYTNSSQNLAAQDKPSKAWKQFKRWESFWEPRVFPNGRFPDAVELIKDIRALETSKREAAQSLDYRWFELGPKYLFTTYKDATLYGHGRINCVRFHPDDDKIIYIGSATGGIWKSEDAGQTWRALDLGAIMSIGIADIAIDPSNPNVIYAATGDAEAASFSSSYSVGIIKSIDGGEKWTLTGFSASLPENAIVSRILIDPNNPMKIFAATNRGIYISVDGGSHWNLASEDRYFKDIEIPASDASLIIASTFSFGGGAEVFVSIDGGGKWELSKTFPGIVRIALAHSKSSPTKIYALCAQKDGNNFGGLFAYDVSSREWTEIQANKDIVEGQGFFNLAFAVDPFQESALFAGGIRYNYSIDGGKTWVGRNDGIHVDFHDLRFNPHTMELFAATDGGLYKTSDFGYSWKNLSEGLSVTQFYRFGAAKLKEERLMGGSQDNGVLRNREGVWEHIASGDAMECVFDPIYQYIAYSLGSNGSLAKTLDGGESFTSIMFPGKVGENSAWIAPFDIDKTDPRKIFVGYENIHMSSDRGKQWTKISNFAHNSTLSALAVSPTNGAYIYASSGQNLYKTSQTGGSWVTKFIAPAYISDIEILPEDPNKVLITLSGYQPGEKVFFFNGGEWENISYNLPNIPFNCIVYHRDSIGEMFVGSDVGVFRKSADSKSWEYLANGMPAAIVSELEIHKGTGNLRAATYGRGIWETEIYDCPEIEKPFLQLNGEKQFCRGSEVRLTVINAGDYEYVWSNGKSGKSISAEYSGEYFVAAIDSNGCIASSESVFLEALPKPDLTVEVVKGSFVFCEGDSIVLEAVAQSNGGGAITYLWSTGDTSKRLAIKKQGRYWVEAINEFGCFNKFDLIKVEVNPIPHKPNIYAHSNILETDEANFYQWYFEGEPIEGGNKRKLTIDKTGNYQVEIRNEFGCANRSDVLEVTTNVEDSRNDNRVNIFPNPNDGEFVISGSNLNVIRSEISISDVLGSKIIEKQIDLTDGRFKQIFDLTGYAPGIYFVKIQIGEISLIKEIFVY